VNHVELSTAAASNVGVVLGTGRVVGNALLISALVINRDGTVAGFQDKVQLDPSEDAIYTPGVERHLFRAGPLIFGAAICHEGFRYPEKVRWAAKRSAHFVFHPHLSEAEGDIIAPDLDQTKLNGGAATGDGQINSIDPAKLPRDPASNCNPVYPQNFVRTNTVFGVIHKAHPT
jgi:predicted amidohydrolase